jgi:hypothetical protein
MRHGLAATFGLDDEESRVFANALRCTALPILGVLFYLAHGYLADFLMDLGNVPGADLRNALLVSGSLVAPAIAASVFALPIAVAFPRHATGASLLIGLPSMKISLGHAMQSADKPYWLASSIIALVGIALLLPLAARIAQSRLRRSSRQNSSASLR